MKRISIKYLKPGMRLAQTVYAGNGQVLLGSGMEISALIIKRLQDMELTHLYIDTGQFKPLNEVSQTELETTRVATTRNVEQAFVILEKVEKLEMGPIRQDVERLINDLLENRSILAGLFFIRNHEDYGIQHALQVCILSLIIGIKLEYNRSKLLELGLGALLHDIGMVKIEKRILDKEGSLDYEEIDTVQQHVECGFQMLQREDISLLAGNIALQHHERWNGTGYPRGLAGMQIQEYARIVAVADVFSALISERPYRSAYSFDDGVEFLTTMAGYYFDPRMVNAFLEALIHYPIGGYVLLSTGEFGRVVYVHEQVPTRPTVHVIADRAMNRVNNTEVNLYKNQEIEIRKMLNQEETSQLLRSIQ